MSEALMSIRVMPRLSALTAALVLAGCAAVGPDHQTPPLALDASFIQPGSNQPDSRPATPDIVAFWRGFNDAQLTTLIERAVAANGDVRIAQARLQEARAGFDEADSASRPSAGFSGSAERAVQPITQRPGTTRSERTGNTFDASFIANWEIDLFGGASRSSAWMKCSKDSVRTTKPGGTSIPARVSSPRLPPLPPTCGRSSSVRSAKTLMWRDPVTAGSPRHGRRPRGCAGHP